MDYITGFWEQYGGAVVNFGVALAFLLGFYIAARIVRAIIKKVMLKTELDNRFAETVGLKDGFPVESVAGGVAFWVIMTYGILTFFDKLNLQSVAQPIGAFLTEIFAFLPKLGAAVGLLIIAWVLASLLKLFINKLAGMLGVDKRLNELDDTGSEEFTVSDSLATAGYWFVFLLFLPMILGALQMQGLVTPLQDMFSKVFTYMPNIVSALLIFVVGSFVGRIVRKIVGSLLVAAGADGLSEKLGLQQKISALVGTLAFTVIMLLVVVQSLDALKIEAVSAPAKNVIEMIFLAVPGIISAALVLTISYFVGKLLAGLVSDLLSSAGFNNVTAKMGIRAELKRTPSEYVGSLVMLGVILFALLGATELLGFEPLSNIVSDLIYFAFQVLLGALVLGIGIIVANKVFEVVAGSGMSPVAGHMARAAILILVTAMALRQVGVAESIINLAFGLLLGALAAGAAIAIGLGCKDIAGREAEKVIEKLRK